MSEDAPLYEPEIGQMLFGQPSKPYAPNERVIKAIQAIADAFRNAGDFIDIDTPFGNTGTKFLNSAFAVEAYSWDEDEEQPFNFKWRDFEVSWYKYFPRGLSMNRPIGDIELDVMEKECIHSLTGD